MQRLTFGSITVDAVSDGELGLPLERVLPGSVPAAIGRLGGVDEAGLIWFTLTTFVVRAAGRLILIDTGMGPDIGPLERFGFTGRAGLLPGGLRDAGVDLERVDAVVATHLHGDHIGWNTVGEGGDLRPMFPNARYVVSRTEWEHRQTVAGRHGVARCLDPVEASGQLTLVDDGYEVAPGVSLLATPGHTPGHVSVLVTSGGEGGVITGDAADHPSEIEDPDLSPAFDMDLAQSAASRRVLVERAEAEGLVILGGHFPEPIAGHVVRVGAVRTWRWLEGPAE